MPWGYEAGLGARTPGGRFVCGGGYGAGHGGLWYPKSHFGQSDSHLLYLHIGFLSKNVAVEGPAAFQEFGNFCLLVLESEYFSSKQAAE